MKAFLAGLGIGIVVGILFAPESGEVNRKNLGRLVTEWSENRGRAIDESKNRFQVQSTPSDDNDVDEGLSPRKEQARAGSSDSADSINTMSREELMNVNGIGPVLANKIISSRPYSSRKELVDRGILPQSTFEVCSGRSRVGRNVPHDGEADDDPRPLYFC